MLELASPPPLTAETIRWRLLVVLSLMSTTRIVWSGACSAHDSTGPPFDSVVLSSREPGGAAWAKKSRP